MAVSRRSVLKALALAPGLPLLNSRLAQALMLQDELKSSFILLHGMWFMEFYNGKLYIATPNHSAHHFCVRPHEGQLQKMGTDVDDLSGVLIQGPKNSFPPEIPQFPKSLIGNFGPRTAKKYRYMMILPQPKNIFGYRSDTKDKFTPVKGNKIGEAIQTSTGLRLATITCLELSTKNTPFVKSYYASHKTRPTANAVNAALVSAQDICGGNFNLKLDPLKKLPPRAPQDPAGYPTGVSKSDENELEELLTGGKPACDEKSGSPIMATEAADVASCPQFGINP